MKKENRLRKSKEFDRVYKHGKNYWNRQLTIYVYKNNTETTRVGYTITKKIGNAVTRNKVRRRMKEIVRLNFENIDSGYDIIFIPKKNVVDLPYDKLEKSMIHVMTVGKIYKR